MKNGLEKKTEATKVDLVEGINVFSCLLLLLLAVSPLAPTVKAKMEPCSTTALTPLTLPPLLPPNKVAWLEMVWTMKIKASSYFTNGRTSPHSNTLPLLHRCRRHNHNV